MDRPHLGRYHDACSGKRKDERSDGHSRSKADFQGGVREHHRLGDRTIRLPGHRRDRSDGLGRRLLQDARPCGGGCGDFGLRSRHYDPAARRLHFRPHRRPTRPTGRNGLRARADGRLDASDRAYAGLRQGRRPRAGTADCVSAPARDQFRRRVRHSVDLGRRTGRAVEISRFLGRLGRDGDSDRASARLWLGNLREVADDRRTIQRLGLAHLLFRRLPCRGCRRDHPHAHDGQLRLRAAQDAGRSSPISIRSSSGEICRSRFCAPRW